MCTVTVVTPSDRPLRWRMACNRDELRTRAAAQPPVTKAWGNLRAIMPIDPTSGGTWAAVNDAGVAVTLLNVNRPDIQANSGGQVKSRGLIVPAIVQSRSTREAANLAGAIDPAGYPPFRLVIVDDCDVVSLYSDGRTMRDEWLPTAAAPFLFTSSGLGDHLVEPPRRELFAEFFYTRSVDDYCARQDEYHRHRWPDRPHLSVRMERQDARTVSFTTIERRDDGVSLSYLPAAPGQVGEPVTIDMLCSDRIGDP